MPQDHPLAPCNLHSYQTTTWEAALCAKNITTVLHLLKTPVTEVENHPCLGHCSPQVTSIVPFHGEPLAAAAAAAPCQPHLFITAAAGAGPPSALQKKAFPGQACRVPRVPRAETSGHAPHLHRPNGIDRALLRLPEVRNYHHQIARLDHIPPLQQLQWAGWVGGAQGAWAPVGGAGSQAAGLLCAQWQATSCPAAGQQDAAPGMPVPAGGGRGNSAVLHCLMGTHPCSHPLPPLLLPPGPLPPPPPVPHSLPPSCPLTLSP